MAHVNCISGFWFLKLVLLFLLVATVACDGPTNPECPNQEQSQAFSGTEFGKIYPSSATKVGVKFTTNDATLQKVYDHAITCESSNTQEFLPGLFNVVEGSHYGNVWLETQPMAGAMWAVRNLTEALANQLIFMRTQRKDGRLPGMVTTNHGKFWPYYSNCNDSTVPTVCAVYCIGEESLLQGNYFSPTSVDVAWFLNVSDAVTATEYVTELHGVLERFDDWMWNNRRSTLPGFSDVLTCPSAADWGGDGYNGYSGLPKPFLSMDMMGYAHSNAMALVRTSRILGNISGATHWNSKAQAVATSMKRALWIDEKGALYDVDGKGNVVDVLVHNNLRTMWHGAMSQSMAETFVLRHLHNHSEFWSTFPLPSISVSDPKYVPGLPRNTWAGPSEGLTYQRAIRALENYGFHAEITLLGELLVKAVAVNVTYPQQWNPQLYQGIQAGAAGPGDCYGPALLSVLEYTTYAHGIKPRPSDGNLLFSASHVNTTLPVPSVYTQTLGDHSWTLRSTQSSFMGEVDGKAIFTSTRGVRIITTSSASDVKVIGVVGISPSNVSLDLHIDGAGDVVSGFVIEPNCEYEVDADEMRISLTRRVPFVYPGLK